MNFHPSPRPQDSIWGHVQTASRLLAGIWHVTTASHGGIILSDERQSAMPDALRDTSPYYEEDVEWGRVFIAFEREFRTAKPQRIDIEMQLAHDTVRTYHPREYGVFTGIAVAPRDSHVLRKIAAYKAVMGQHVVTAAWGDWADWVPKGKVGLSAAVVTGVDHLGFASYDQGSQIRALADASRYKDRPDVVTLAALDAVVQSSIIIDSPDRTVY